MTIGILALQGDFSPHIHMLTSLNSAAVEVRTPVDLSLCDSLIIPGGESTTIGKLAVQFGLINPLKDFIARGKPVWGTCAGAILIANSVSDYPITTTKKRGPLANGARKGWIGGMDITVVRNAFGRQVDSFEEPIYIEGIKNSDKPFNAIFIRAPVLQSVGKNAQILSKLSDGTIVAARENNLLATSFHPELTDDFRMHEYFLTF